MSRAARTVLTVLLCIAPALSSAAAPPAATTAKARRELACALAQQIVDDIRTRDVTGERLLDAEPVKHNSFALPNPTPLLRRWLEAGPSNLFVACPQLRARVGSLRFATADDRAAVRLFPPPRFFSIDSFTAPFLDPAGTTALVQFNSECPGLCGSGWVKRYERRRGAWVDVETFGLWVS